MKSIYMVFTLLGLLLIALFYYLFFFRLHVSTLLSYLLAVNITTMILYASDKLSAKVNKLRVPEYVLHLFELVGGTFFALIAQQVLWHKSTKRAYQIKFWLIVVFQVSVYAVVFHTDFLKSIF